MTWGDREPIFVQKGRWVYNTRSPIARALMVATAVGLIGFYVYEADNSQWSEAELRDAVHEAARDLEAQPQKVGLVRPYGSLVRDAVLATGHGPRYPLLDVKRTGDGTDVVTSPTEDSFEISTADTSETYCMRLSPPEPPSTGGEWITVRLTVQVSQGSC
ncbi:hypothetical protein [Streptomyces sp. CC208A]|uniref:hypothetical protein n=1 Tax=Streptomyces sp. CC208A TaxID=3044573 RepID=UPI0024A9CDBA|nr:hypothetical protein [Streptomyces sp. CC208A]